MITQLRMCTPKQALAGVGLLTVSIVRYISAILTWWKDSNNLLSNIQSALGFIYEYPLTLSMCKLRLDFSRVYYHLDL